MVGVRNEGSGHPPRVAGSAALGPFTRYGGVKGRKGEAGPGWHSPYAVRVGGRWGETPSHPIRVAIGPFGVSCCLRALDHKNNRAVLYLWHDTDTPFRVITWRRAALWSAPRGAGGATHESEGLPMSEDETTKTDKQAATAPITSPEVAPAGPKHRKPERQAGGIRPFDGPTMHTEPRKPAN